MQLIYPVGSLYITTLNYCPLATIGVGTWQKVGEGRVLQMANSSQSANNTIEAGLPNITGSINMEQNCINSNGIGAFTLVTGSAYHHNYHKSTGINQINFNAQLSNRIYGRSTTVQPPAYLVNTYRRIS